MLVEQHKGIKDQRCHVIESRAQSSLHIDPIEYICLYIIVHITYNGGNC